MKFKELSPQDVEYITSLYSMNDLSKEDAQRSLSEQYDVSERTIRRWASKLNLVDSLPNWSDNDKHNILVIGDLHAPFTLKGYLPFCIEQYKKYKCTKVIFIGDIIDNHYSSYHETNADGFGGGEELELAIQELSKWYKAFPKATVIIGNHDRMVMRKAQTSAIPKAWIKDYKDVLGVDGWKFTDREVIGNVQYIHGEAGEAKSKCKSDMMSTVQGHLHTKAYTEWFVGANFRVFGSQVGCGIDHESYAMAYAKRGNKPAIGCMVILNEELPINLMMNL